MQELEIQAGAPWRSIGPAWRQTSLFAGASQLVGLSFHPKAFSGAQVVLRTYKVRVALRLRISLRKTNALESSTECFSKDLCWWLSRLMLSLGRIGLARLRTREMQSTKNQDP